MRLRKKILQVLKSRWLPWLILGGVILLELVFISIQSNQLGNWSRGSQILVGLFIFIGLLFGYLFINRVMDLYDQRDRLNKQVLESERQISQAYQRLDAIIQVGQKFVESTEENDLIELILKLAIDLAKVKGASYVPLDEHSQPMTATSFGELPFPVMNPWLEYLASPAVRENCRTCEQHERVSGICPLLKGPIPESVGILCYPLRRGGREFGIVNLYLETPQPLDQQTQSFLGALMDVTALALESVRLRRRELSTLRQMQNIRDKTDLHALLNKLLESVYQLMEADVAVLVVKPLTTGQNFPRLAIGEIPGQLQPFIDGIMSSILESAEPVLFGDVSSNPKVKSGFRSYLAAPLLSNERTAMGAVLVGVRRGNDYNNRQLGLLQTVAGQIALILQNSRLVSELEFQSIMEERRRLAREIHDGLAQTLGYLKLQTAQIKGYLVREEYPHTEQAINQFYSILDEAYQDVRQTIDGLRIGVGDQGIQGWLAEAISDFQEVSSLSINLHRVETNARLPSEVHAQLMRIVQETLSNIRKHSGATQVLIDVFEQDGDVWLEIQDNGHGFLPEDVSGLSRHGLRGMRERADLIGAEFQVISQPGQGTTIRTRIPLQTPKLNERSS